MKIVVQLSTYHFNLLKEISYYVDIEPEKLAKDIIETHVKQFDNDMEKILYNFERNTDDYID